MNQTAVCVYVRCKQLYTCNDTYVEVCTQIKRVNENFWLCAHPQLLCLPSIKTTTNITNYSGINNQTCNVHRTKHSKITTASPRLRVKALPGNSSVPAQIRGGSAESSISSPACTCRRFTKEQRGNTKPYNRPQQYALYSY